MPISKKWKVVGGSMSMAVVLGGTAAIAGEGDDGPDLDDVVSVQEVETTTTSAGIQVVGIAQDDGSLDSPFAAADDTPEAEETPEGVETPDGEDSPETADGEDSPESPESEDSPESPESEDSPETPETEDSPESPESEDSPDSPDDADSPEA